VRPGGIERDGNTLLKAGVFHGVGENKATLWRTLGDGSFEAVGPLPAPAAESGQATLAGSLRVVVFMGPRAHDGRQFAVPIDSLRFVRVPGKADRWRIPADELERIGRAAGVLPWVEPWVVGVVMAGCVLLVVVWLMRRRRRAARTSPAGA
jgi:hypothetical protein